MKRGALEFSFLFYFFLFWMCFHFYRTNNNLITNGSVNRSTMRSVTFQKMTRAKFRILTLFVLVLFVKRGLPCRSVKPKCSFLTELCEWTVFPLLVEPMFCHIHIWNCLVIPTYFNTCTDNRYDINLWISPCVVSDVSFHLACMKTRESLTQVDNCKLIREKEKKKEKIKFKRHALY